MFVNLTAVRTYATAENAKKAAEKKLHADTLRDVTWFIQRDEAGRFFPVFVGERALQHMVHFHFNVVA